MAHALCLTYIYMHTSIYIYICTPMSTHYMGLPLLSIILTATATEDQPSTRYPLISPQEDHKPLNGGLLEPMSCQSYGPGIHNSKIVTVAH